MMDSQLALLIILLVGIAIGVAAAFVFVLVAVKRAKALRAHQAPAPLTGQKLDELIPDSCYTDVDGVKLHYVQAGSGPDIVLLHGIGASVFIWRFLFPILQTRHRVTALDLAGFGKSAKSRDRDYGLDAQTDLVARAIKQLNLKDPLVVGSSMGGAITLWLAKKYPNEFSRIVVLAPATDASLVPTQVKYMATAAPYLKHALNKRTMRLILQRVLSKHDLITDSVVDAYLQPFLDEGDAVRAFWAATSLLADRRLPKQLTDLKSKVLVIHGKKDFLVSSRSIRRLMKILPNARLLSHSDGGHHIMEDEPAWIAASIEQFLH